MYKIISNTTIYDNINRLEVEAPYIAQHHKAGQFIIMVNNETSERIPLTVADTNKKKGSVIIFYQAIGKSTRDLAAKKPGDCIKHISGPLGTPTHIDYKGTVACIGGGIGIATLLPIAKAYKKMNNTLISIAGGRSKDNIILRDELSLLSDEIHFCTDDGSLGTKGYVTDLLISIMQQRTLNRIIAVGPVLMMKEVCKLSKKNNIETIVSLNSIMIDGTGMCGGCRITVGGERKFTCVDGPEFDGHAVDFDELAQRLNTYSDQEKNSIEKHNCKLEQKIDTNNR